MSVTVMLEVKAKPDSIDALRQGLAALLPGTRAFEGCQGLTTYQDLEDGQTLVAVEHWDSKEHYERYLAWRTETGAMAQLVSLLEGPPNIRYFEAVPA